MSNGEYEPTADMRVAAAGMYDWFQGLIQAGFTESQAIGIIGTVIGATIREKVAAVPSNSKRGSSSAWNTGMATNIPSVLGIEAPSARAKFSNVCRSSRACMVLDA